MKTYSTVQGDEWDEICYKLYGTEWVMDTLMHANPHLIGISRFSAGTIIKLPEINNIVENEDLPPWVMP